jgi:cytochrome c-type biogenesis protein CcmH
VTAFVIAAAALAAMTVLAVVVPLVRRAPGARGTTQSEASIAVLRDQLAELERDLANGTLGREGYESARRELKRRILEDCAPEALPGERPHFGSTLALALAVPLAALLLYAWLGNPAALDPQARLAAQPHPDAAQFEAMVEKLASRLRSTPGDAEGWLMLARSYRALGRHPDAAAAFGRAEARVASDARLLTEWAESTALAAGGTLSGRPAELLARALAIDPDYGHALALAGAAAFERADWKEALAHWERLAGRLAKDSPEAEMVARSIAAAREQLGTAAPDRPEPAAPAAPARVAGRVSLAPALASQASPTDTVFIFARAAGGPPAPLAVLKKQVKDLPAEFSLDDSMAMAPSLKLSGFAEVVVGARVSKSGNAIPQSGDLQGLTRPVKVGATGVALVIDSALP